MTEKDLNYSFTSIPTTFIYAMDNDCYKAISLLIQEESYWKAKGKLENGCFFKAVNEIKDVLSMKNEKDTRLTIEALYRKKLIDVDATSGKRQTLRIRLNWREIVRIANMSITDILKFETKIEKLKRTDTITYCKNSDTECVQNVDNPYKIESKKKCNLDTEPDTECTPTLNSTENKDNIDKKNNIFKNNIDNQYFNSSNRYISKYKDASIQDTDTCTSTTSNLKMLTNAQYDVLIKDAKMNLYKLASNALIGTQANEDDEIFQDTIKDLMVAEHYDLNTAKIKVLQGIENFKSGILKKRQEIAEHQS